MSVHGRTENRIKEDANCRIWVFKIAHSTGSETIFLIDSDLSKFPISFATNEVCLLGQVLRKTPEWCRTVILHQILTLVCGRMRSQQSHTKQGMRTLYMMQLLQQRIRFPIASVFLNRDEARIIHFSTMESIFRCPFALLFFEFFLHYLSLILLLTWRPVWSAHA